VRGPLLPHVTPSRICEESPLMEEGEVPSSSSTREKNFLFNRGVLRGCCLPSQILEILRFAQDDNKWRRAEPSSNSTQKRLYAFGGKEEIPNKRRSGRHFVSVRKGSVPPFDSKAEISRYARNDPQRRHPEERSDEGSPPLNG